jgi:hypothetical protein
MLTSAAMQRTVPRSSSDPMHPAAADASGSNRDSHDGGIGCRTECVATHQHGLCAPCSPYGRPLQLRKQLLPTNFARQALAWDSICIADCGPSAWVEAVE